MIIYIVVVIEDYYEKVVIANPDIGFKLTFGIFIILIFGLLIFLLVMSSPQLHRLLFRMFGADEPEASSVTKRTN
jgi:glucan phosphoethanolaminetransferase (alkaline phosphatase superfamily)